MSSIDAQSAEIIIQSDMNDQHPMGESHQQHYSQPTTYYDDNDTQQRDSLIHSLAQNPHMLNDFYRFLEFTRAHNAQQVFQPLYNGQSIQHQQHIPSILNIKTNSQHTSSTPKRGRPLNDSGGSISSAPKQLKPSESTPRQKEDAVTTNQQQRKALPFDQLKRAVSSNLPCFYIEFDQSTTTQQLPSAFEARNIIENNFKENNVHIQHFSLVGWANKRLKLGVNNKEDYMVLVATDKWPSTVKNIAIKIIKPKYIPDCFALVVRYVPRELEIEFVKEEIKRTIASADNIKQIHYAYERKSNDFRFIVTDLTEYNTARELGRISIGNRLLSITPFLTGNRMTYCTRCWKIGHLREQCKTNIQRCRVCLEELTKNEEHICNNIPKCAQCDGEHHSLNGQCHVIQQYRADLKENVDKALESGKLHRNDYTNQQSEFIMKNQDFPQLIELKKPQQPPWNRIQTESRTNETSDSTKALFLINENLVAMCESNKRVEEKLEKIDLKLNQTALDTELHQETIINLIECARSLIEHVIWPVTSQVNANLLQSKTGLQSMLNKLRDLKSNLNNDYNIRRKRASSPPISSKLLATSEETNNSGTTTLNNHK